MCYTRFDSNYTHTNPRRPNFILNADGPVKDNILMDVPEKWAGYTHVALEVTDLEAVQSRLAELGIPLSGGPVKVPDGAEFVFIRDPDKNVIEFHQPAAKPVGYRPH